MPLNYILLSLFTLGESISLSGFVFVLDTDVVLTAFFLTFGMTLVLTVYALTTDKDITYSRAARKNHLILLSSLVYICFGSLIMLFTSLFIGTSPFLHKLYLIFGVVAYGFYLVHFIIISRKIYDT